MSKKRADQGDPGDLRRRAEERLGASRGGTADERNMAPQAQRIVHELEVHQIELELQNGAEVLRPAGLDDAIDRTKEALGGTQRIKDVVKVLGTFSRVEHVQLSSIDPAGAIEAAVNMVKNEIKYRARLVTDLREVPRIWASEGTLTQVVLNLLIKTTGAAKDRSETLAKDVTLETQRTQERYPQTPPHPLAAQSAHRHSGSG